MTLPRPSAGIPGPRAGKSRLAMELAKREARASGRAVTRVLIVGPREERTIELGADGEPVIDVEVACVPGKEANRV